jgi:hypothetical protein
MKGVFGILLIGGGVILVYGLFTGKITFPGSPGIGPDTPIGQTPVGAVTGHTAPYVGPPPSPTKSTPVDKNGNCPQGMTAVLGFCIPNWMLGLPQVAP